MCVISFYLLAEDPSTHVICIAVDAHVNITPFPQVTKLINKPLPACHTALQCETKFSYTYI